MAESQSETGAAEPRRPDPVVRRIAIHDVIEAFIAGLRDFQAAPLFGLFFGGIYALGGLSILMSLTRFGMPYLAYPLAAGFVLIGPFVAVGLYEVSRRREAGEPLGWGQVLGVVFAQGQREMGWMAFVTLFVMMMWLYQVRLLLALFLGFQSFSSFSGFLTVLTSTPEGADVSWPWATSSAPCWATILVFADGDLLPAAARPRGRFHHRHDHQRAGGVDQSAADAGLRGGDRGSVLRGDAAALPRARRAPAGARPCDLASLPAGGRAGGLSRDAGAGAACCHDASRGCCQSPR